MRLVITVISILLFASFHIWNSILAFQLSFWKGLLTMVALIVADIYWYIKLFDFTSLHTIIGSLVWLTAIIRIILKKKS